MHDHRPRHSCHLALAEGESATTKGGNAEGSSISLSVGRNPRAGAGHVCQLADVYTIVQISRNGGSRDPGTILFFTIK